MQGLKPGKKGLHSTLIYLIAFIIFAIIIMIIFWNIKKAIFG